LTKRHANHAVSKDIRVSYDSPLSSSWWKRKGPPLVCWNALCESTVRFYSLGLVSGGLRKQAASLLYVDRLPAGHFGIFRLAKEKL